MKVLLIGELAHDINIYGQAKRLSPEAPIPVFLPNETKMNLGMAGNVLNNLKSLEPNLEVDTIFNSIPIKKTRYIDSDSGYIMLRVDENDKILKTDIFGEHGGTQKQNLSYYDAVIISDYNKEFLTCKDICYIAYFCNKNKVPIFLDTKKFLGRWSEQIDFIKINNKEFNDNLNYWNKNDSHDSFYKHLIVTQGKEGALLYNENFSHKLDEIEVRDTSGCGDSFLAGLVIEYLRSNDIKKSIIFANKVGRVAASKRGIVAVAKNEVI